MFFELMDALSLCVRFGEEFRFPSLMPRLECIPTIEGGFGMRFHLTHVPGLQTKLGIPPVFFHKLSMLIAGKLGRRAETMDLYANGIVLKMPETVIVMLRGSNLFLLVDGKNGRKCLSKAHTRIRRKLPSQF